MSSKQQLICITGADGTGKSTIIKALSERMPDAYVANIWDLLEDTQGMLFRSKQDIDQYLCALNPDARVLFLTHALNYSTAKALHSNAQTVLFNAYWYKYFATELAMGANDTLVQSLIASFPVPDQVIRLKLNPEQTADRKQKFSKYECGATGNNTASDFIRFQRSVLLRWNKFESKAWVNIDASASIEEVLQNTLTALQR